MLDLNKFVLNLENATFNSKFIFFENLTKFNKHTFRLDFSGDSPPINFKDFYKNLLVKSILNGDNEKVSFLLGPQSTITLFLLTKKFPQEVINETHEISGDTLLHLAIKTGNLDIVQYLINVGADFRIENKDGNNALLLAAISGNIDIFSLIHFICENDHNLSEYYQKALFFAALNNNVKVVDFLVNNTKIDINLIDFWGNTALDIADKLGYKKTVALLKNKKSSLLLPGLQGDESDHNDILEANEFNFRPCLGISAENEGTV